MAVDADSVDIRNDHMASTVDAIRQQEREQLKRQNLLPIDLIEYIKSSIEVMMTMKVEELNALQ